MQFRGGIAFVVGLVVWGFCCSSVVLGSAAASDLVGPGPIPLTKNAQFSGLVQVNATTNAQMFYWWFTSNLAPQSPTTPVVVWLEGGPGFSSVFQALYGMGPYRLSSSGVAFNNDTWLNDAHLLFLDNPCGVGYSTVNSGGEVTNQSDMAEQLYALLDVFFRQLHPEFLANPLYIFGESYGGKYCPSIAAYIYEVELSMAPAQRLNFKGIGIGNGLTDTPNQSLTFASFLFNHGAITISQHTQLTTMQEQFQQLYQAKLYSNASDAFWQMVFFAQKAGLNMYNVDCFLQCGKERFLWTDLIPYMSRADVKQQLHVPSMTVFENPSPAVSAALNADVCKSVAHLMPTILSNYRVLLYEGVLDYVVNAAGVEIWLSKVQWSGMQAFQLTKRQRWFSKPNGDLEITGFVQQYSNLTQLLLPNTGHFATIDQPAVTAAMVHNWLYNIPFSPRE